MTEHGRLLLRMSNLAPLLEDTLFDGREFW